MTRTQQAALRTQTADALTAGTLTCLEALRAAAHYRRTHALDGVADVIEDAVAQWQTASVARQTAIHARLMGTPDSAAHVEVLV